MCSTVCVCVHGPMSGCMASSLTSAGKTDEVACRTTCLVLGLQDCRTCRMLTARTARCITATCRAMTLCMVSTLAVRALCIDVLGQRGECRGEAGARQHTRDCLQLNRPPREVQASPVLTSVTPKTCRSHLSCMQTVASVAY